MQALIARALTEQGRGSQTRLAKRVGVTPQTVNKWVKGQTLPEMDRWAEIEDALDLEAGSLSAAAGFGDIAYLRTAPDDDVTRPLIPADDDTLSTLRELHPLIETLGTALERLEGRIEALEQRLDRPDPPPDRPSPTTGRRAR